MTRLILLPAARTDLVQIWSDTAARWDVSQADKYLAGINSRLDGIAELPSRYPEYRSNRRVFRKASAGEHLIFYVVRSEQIDIVRILHNRMDVADLLT